MRGTASTRLVSEVWGEGEVKFRRKPVVFEAEQFFPDKKPWPNGVTHGFQFVDQKESIGFQILTLEGQHIVSPGDWIITGIKGEKWPVKPDIFEATYEPVE